MDAGFALRCRPALTDAAGSRTPRTARVRRGPRALACRSSRALEPHRPHELDLVNAAPAEPGEVAQERLVARGCRGAHARARTSLRWALRPVQDRRGRHGDMRS